MTVVFAVDSEPPLGVILVLKFRVTSVLAVILINILVSLKELYAIVGWSGVAFRTESITPSSPTSITLSALLS